MTHSRAKGTRRQSVRSAPTGQTAAAEQRDVNVVVVVGVAAKDAVATGTADGSVYTSFDLVCRTVEGRTVVPVSYRGDCNVRAGQRVAVAGAVHKRFFSAGSGLAARTDVRADTVRIITRKDQVSRVIAAAISVLGDG